MKDERICKLCDTYKRRTCPEDRCIYAWSSKFGIYLIDDVKENRGEITRDNSLAWCTRDCQFLLEHLMATEDSK